VESSFLSFSSESQRHESKFNDVINDIRAKKIELFGNPEENMDFYKRNKNVFDTRVLERSFKIAKILELEELLQFYDSSSIILNQNKQDEVSYVNSDFYLKNSLKTKIRQETDNKKLDTSKNNTNTEKNLIQSQDLTNSLQKHKFIKENILYSKLSNENVKIVSLNKYD
jgi:hypothetical protein